MELSYRVVDVFARGPLTGNPLAVFPDAPDLPDALMQRIAREMNLSETTFVTSAEGARYTVRIFTPSAELPFAGHPTLGTAWVLRDESSVTGDAVVQQSAAGDTPVTFEGDEVWFERGGDGGTELSDLESLASQLGIDADLLGPQWEWAGRDMQLRPAVPNCGIAQAIVPVNSLEGLQSIRAAGVREPEASQGVYFFVQTGPESVTARFFAGGIGVEEDPATGSAAANLGLYLGKRLGTGRVVISQGEQVGRPSTLHTQFEPDRVRVGGHVVPMARGVLTI